MLKRVFLWLIKCYQICISPYKGRTCRFYPTCSEYSYVAIERFGIIKGSYMSVKRILRCNPFNKGGYDPVPEKE